MYMYTLFSHNEVLHKINFNTAGVGTVILDMVECKPGYLHVII